jgi:hypothetical protein
MTRAILHAIAVSLLVFVVWIVSGAVYAMFAAAHAQTIEGEAMKTNKPIRLMLCVEVVYKPNGATEAKLIDVLKGLADEAAARGKLTAGTDAEVMQWTSEARHCGR